MARAKLQPLVKIDYDDFYNYVMVQFNGNVNMMDSSVREAIGISKDIHFSIMHHYEALNEKWPDVRKSLDKG